MRIPLRRLPCGYHTLRITQSLPDANLYSKLPHAFQQLLDLFCYFLYFLFQSDQFPAVHLFFLRHFQSMYRLNQKYSRLGLKLFRQMCLFQTVSKAFQILSGSLTVGYQKKVPAGRIKPAFFVSNFWFLSIVFYCNVL